MTKTCDAPLTDKQRELLEFIRRSPRCPTVREMAAHYGVQINAIAGKLRSLERKGFIRRDGLSRGIELTDGPTV